MSVRESREDPDSERSTLNARQEEIGIMSLSSDQKKFYENTLQVTKREITELEELIQQELAKVKDRLAELQNAQKAARQMYDAACMRLGIANDLEEAEAQG